MYLVAGNIVQDSAGPIWHSVLMSNKPEQNSPSVDMSPMVHDAALGIQACFFQGVRQTFPNHFHEYYLIGLVEAGARAVGWQGKEYGCGSGDILLFNPREPHACIQLGDGGFTFRSFCVSPAAMADIAHALTGTSLMPLFREPLVRHAELALCMRETHQMVMEQVPDMEKEEGFLFFMETLLAECAHLRDQSQLLPVVPAAIDLVQRHLEAHYAEAVTLEQLCDLTGLSKYYLLRSFTRRMGIAPYAYLETLRLERAREFLERGMAPVDVAIHCGFNDQSHFSNFFKRRMGLTPGQYQRIFLDARKDMTC